MQMETVPVIPRAPEYERPPGIPLMARVGMEETEAPSKETI